MEYVLTIEQMKKADSSAINEYGISGEILMENAARSAAEFVIDIFESEEMFYPSVDIICGSGNNGGDGFALARHLHENFDLRVFWIGDPEKMSKETKNNFQSVGKLGIDIQHIKSIEDLSGISFSEDCLIDSMVGVGGSENIKGLALDILKKIEVNPALKIAIDAPTGLNTDTGIANDHCFYADYTITMFAIKTGMMLNEGPDVCGVILPAYLGAPDHIVEQYSEINILEDNDLIEILPVRNRVSSKFDYGRVIIIAGSKRFPGASALCSNAAILSGSGLVQLYTTSIHHSLLPEIIPMIVEESPSGSISIMAFDKICKDADQGDVIIIGSGLSDDDETLELTKKIIYKYMNDKIIIVDADAIKVLDKDSQLTKNVIITPHCGEFSKLTGIDRLAIERNHHQLAVEWANKLNCNIVLKHLPVVITNGKYTYWNITGNPGMATAGCGDVLSGLIGGFSAQNIAPLEAAALSVYLHAKAGDIYADEFSQESLTASKLLGFLPEAMRI